MQPEQRMRKREKNKMPQDRVNKGGSARITISG
jgi:hypothetical protein